MIFNLHIESNVLEGKNDGKLIKMILDIKSKFMKLCLLFYVCFFFKLEI